MTSPQNVVEVRDLRKTYGDLTAVDGGQVAVGLAQVAHLDDVLR